MLQLRKQAPSLSTDTAPMESFSSFRELASSIFGVFSITGVTVRAPVSYKARSVPIHNDDGTLYANSPFSRHLSICI